MKFLALACAVVFLVSCAGAGSERCPSGTAAAQGEKGGTEGGGSLWDQLERARKQKRDKGTSATHSEAAAKTLPAGWRQKIDGWWALYGKNDAEWPAARAEWLGMADPAPTILVENLMRAYVVAWDAGQRSEFERARDELLAIPQHSVPILAIGLARASGDTVVRNLATDLLAAAGDVAIPAIEKAYADAKPKGRWELVRALRKMRTPSAAPLLSRVATSQESFEARIEALQGLGEIKDAVGYPAALRCLDDPDRSVRKFAAQCLGNLGRPEAIPHLSAARDKAQSRGETDVAEEAQKAIATLGGGS